MESDQEANPDKGLPYKIVDLAREKKKGVVAKSLEDLIQIGQKKLEIPYGTSLKVVLEQDGTEVDDDEYFSTLEQNTTLMLLVDDQKWLPPGRLPSLRVLSDETDASISCNKELEGLVDRLHRDLTHVSMLGGKELELLSNMDPESLTDIIPDSKIFLVQLKEASSRFLSEKRQAQEALELLQLYQKSQPPALSDLPEKKEKIEGK